MSWDVSSEEHIAGERRAPIILAWSDCDGNQLWKSFPPDGGQALMLRDGGVFPGMFGLPALHTRHIDVDVDAKSEDGKRLIGRLYIVTVLDHVMDKAERKQIIADGLKFAYESGLIKPES